jgi:hypothetical protein
MCASVTGSQKSMHSDPDSMGYAETWPDTMIESSDTEDKKGAVLGHIRVYVYVGAACSMQCIHEGSRG